MKELAVSDSIEKRIFVIRGLKVMLDKDISKLYGVKAFRLREQVKRNKDRFPADFMFQLTEQEVDYMVSQNAIPSRKHLGGYLPYVFTEHGAVMLASVLNTKRAVEVSIFVVRAFSKLKEILLTHKEIFEKLDYLEKKFEKHDIEIKNIFQAIRQLMPPRNNPKRIIGFQP